MMVAVPVDAMPKFELGAVRAGSDARGSLLTAVADATVLNELKAMSRLFSNESFFAYRCSGCYLHIRQMTLEMESVG